MVALPSPKGIHLVLLMFFHRLLFNCFCGPFAKELDGERCSTIYTWLAIQQHIRVHRLLYTINKRTKCRHLYYTAAAVLHKSPEDRRSAINNYCPFFSFTPFCLFVWCDSVVANMKMDWFWSAKRKEGFISWWMDGWRVVRPTNKLYS